MSFGAALFAMSAVSAVSQIGQGYAQKEEAKFNATLFEGKANMIDVQAGIESGQYQRLKGQYMSKSTANIAKAGIMPTGSAAAVMVEAQRQISIDQAIGQFNFQQEKNYTKAQADAYRRQGKQAVYTGYSNAFSSLLSGAASYALYNQKTSFDLDTGAKKVA